MTPPNSTASPIDTGPLSWVLGEIRESLSRSAAALREALPQDADARATLMRHAKNFLHQAHGALQIVDIDGIAVISEAVESLLQKVEGGQLGLDEALVNDIATAFQALTEYLEELRSGMPHQPVRLFPYYQALMNGRGAESPHPGDLFFPDLSTAFAPEPARGGTPPADLSSLRGRFELALLGLMKADAAAARTHGAAMRDVIADVVHGQSGARARAFWRVMQGMAEAVGGGHVGVDIEIKRLFGRINLQLRRLSEGSASLAERLQRDALFFIAQIDDAPPAIRELQQAYRLDGMVPRDYAERRYGRIDLEAQLKAKERLAHAKSTWTRIAGGEAALAPAFEADMQALAEAGAGLGSEPLAKLLREMSGIARHAAHGIIADSIGLEMATGLLFLENALNSLNRLPADFAEQAQTLTLRLLSLVEGQPAEQAAPWLNDMSQQAQHRQTMAVLGNEMQSNLRQVEKQLDEYFREPAAQHGTLPDIDRMLGQLQGVLAVLDQPDAVDAIAHARSHLRAFIDAPASTEPPLHACQQVARNVGALGFFIDAMQQDADEARSRFVFDPESGSFQSRLLDRRAPVQPVAAFESAMPAAPHDAAPAEPASAEEDLTRFQQQSATLARALGEQPDDADLQQQLRESLEQMRVNATLVADTGAAERAKAGIRLLDEPNAAPDMLTAIVSAEEAGAPEARAPLPAPSLPESEDAIDAELLEIFIGEADEVLQTVRAVLPQSRHAPRSEEHLTTLRRGFHTLKGSGRMVGLTAFGEAAWSIEQVLNLRLADAAGGDEALFHLLEQAEQLMQAWVADLRETGASSRDGAALIEDARRLREGLPPASQAAAPVAQELPALELGNAAEPEPDFAAAEEDGALPPLPDAPTEATLDELPVEFGFSADADDVPLPPQAVETTAEPVDLSDALDADAFEDAPADVPAGVAAEISAQISAEEAIQAPVAAPIEEPAEAAPGTVIDFPLPGASTASQDENIRRIGTLEISLPLHNIYLAETDELVRRLSQDIAEWRHEPERAVLVQSVHAAHSLAGSSSTVGFSALHEVAFAFEMVMQQLLRKPVALHDADFDLLDANVEVFRAMLQKFNTGIMPEREPGQILLLQRLKADLEQRAAMEPSEPAREADLEAAGIAPDAGDGDDADPVLRQGMHAPVLAHVAVEEPGAESPGSDAAEPVPQDELDADLLPVFLEEGEDMLRQVGQLLASWPAQSDGAAVPQGLLRLFHTLKGSARMAGAMALGHHFHQLETRIEALMRKGAPSPQAIEDLQQAHDLAMQMFEALRHPAPAVMPQAPQAQAPQVPAMPAQTLPAVPTAPPAIPAVQQQEAAVARAAGGAVMRVQAEALDRLLNQAGEVSISRARLENQIGNLQQSLSELTENVGRLRQQLREIEIQAESQIASSKANAADREFDPLEFDRFTRLQELTRMMAETVNDVGSVQQSINRTVDLATGDLLQQARLTRDLQQDLMRVRMVQFASISDRLYRVARQTAKEVDKRVNLDIRGGTVEMDRGVLEHMTGPFEHLLRNAIVHGIESRAQRQARGKAETGELLIEVRQEGNEVVIRFSDDGRGLDLARIRSKAGELGLLALDAPAGDAEVADMIFHPGFSTAEQVTELAGRGVGMDVVRSEAVALGGRIATTSRPGQGVTFEIHLPLTLAVTQVVLLSSAGKTYAVPSVLVQQVQQLRGQALASAYNDGALPWQERQVPLHYLPALLGDAESAPLAQQYSPCLILSSGGEQIAIHVDKVLGNREAVIKNVGPQLARLPGIAGATVLGSGEIVLILDPVQLAQRAHKQALRPAQSEAGAIGAIAELSVSPETAQEPVQGLRTQHIVMVVDDSVTVRRVTQRLLLREGYQVVLAKDGVDALEKLQSITPSVMLVDIEMPRMDGFDLTRNVRDDERTRHIPIVMITSRTAAKHRNYAMELGVNAYLGKPYQEAQLLQLIAGYVADAKMN
ncbi:Hpt domain-containing protein [Noviherbaspirillum humi]|nr:Hpt domain-containing protein [Noviherbaspirillum humi]